MRGLLGYPLKCTLDDGRIAIGKLICVDRLKNLILSNVIEERTTNSLFYRSSDDSAHTSKDSTKMIVAKRQLAQAMIPGIHLLKVEIAESIYQKEVSPIITE
eukprot:CAMPEP_0194133970 /NCGR_PEP_ID=MMETSP0152-20130528/4018_1 /TAXON_ID=1049557 /ORGANISM="Thalassiothrix antarctica, Strain L6-D1" /LENGTH=101 /DNA_ID=CAMNT_0038829435 /DNA_START=104 /DNA_END=409 /DNA_ORIENTATION=+